MGNDRLSGKQVGSQVSRRVTRQLAWIQPVCISMNAVPALKGLRTNAPFFIIVFNFAFPRCTCQNTSLFGIVLKSTSRVPTRPGLFNYRKILTINITIEMSNRIETIVTFLSLSLFTKKLTIF